MSVPAKIFGNELQGRRIRRALLSAAGRPGNLERAWEHRCLIPICGVPLVSHVLHQLHQAGIELVTFVVRPGAEALVAAVRAAELELPGLTVDLLQLGGVFERGDGFYALSLLAAAGRFTHELGTAEETILLSTVDHLFDSDILGEFAAVELREDADAVVLVERDTEELTGLPPSAVNVRLRGDAVEAIGVGLPEAQAIEAGLMACRPSALFGAMAALARHYVEGGDAATPGATDTEVAHFTLAEVLNTLSQKSRVLSRSVAGRLWVAIETQQELRAAKASPILAPQAEPSPEGSPEAAAEADLDEPFLPQDPPEEILQRLLPWTPRCKDVTDVNCTPRKDGVSSRWMYDRRHLLMKMARSPAPSFHVDVADVVFDEIKDELPDLVKAGLAEGSPAASVKAQAEQFGNFCATFLLDVMGGAGAVWGFAEWANVRSGMNNDQWRMICAVVGGLCFVRWLLLQLRGLRHRDGEVLATMLLQVWGAVGAIWGGSEVLGLRTNYPPDCHTGSVGTAWAPGFESCSNTGYFWRCVCLFILFCAVHRWQGLVPKLRILRALSLHGGSFVLEVIGGVGALWGCAEIAVLPGIGPLRTGWGDEHFGQESFDAWRLRCIPIFVLCLARWSSRWGLRMAEAAAVAAVPVEP